MKYTVSLIHFFFSSVNLLCFKVRELENHPDFNAGKGSVLTTQGTVEMEASIMDGKTKRCGAVSGLTTVVNPISLARLVMEKTPHIYLAFHAAEAFARAHVCVTLIIKLYLNFSTFLLKLSSFCRALRRLNQAIS